MKDRLDEVHFYNLSKELWDECRNDTNKLVKDYRGKEIARQLIRSVGSISANIEKGYGRGLGKEYLHFLRISRGSARESKGWYHRSKHLLNEQIITKRENTLNGIIAMITKSLQTLEQKKSLVTRPIKSSSL